MDCKKLFENIDLISIKEVFDLNLKILLFIGGLVGVKVFNDFII